MTEGLGDQERPWERKISMKRLPCLAVLAALPLLGASRAARADEVLVAVAANFAGPMKEVAAAFEKETGVKVQADRDDPMRSRGPHDRTA